MAAAPRMHFAGGGMTNAENISQNMFQPIGSESGVPNVDVNFITSPQLQNGPGPPKGQAARPPKQQDSMQQIAEGTSAANGITGLYNQFGKGAASMIPAAMNPASAAENAALASQIDTEGADTGLSAIINGGGAGASAIAEDAGATAAASSLPAWLSAAFALLADGGAVSDPDNLSSDEQQKAHDMAQPAASLWKYFHPDQGNPIPEPKKDTPKRADGGSVGETFHTSGLLNSAGPGRTDTINTNVPTGSYVIPADVVSGLGEGSTLAGSAVIDRMFSTQPHGIQARPIRHGRGPTPTSPPHPVNPDSGPATVDSQFINSAGAYAKGGKTDDIKSNMAPVVLAGGEHVINDKDIIRKFGSLKKGHAILDHWVVMMRRKIAKEMLKLPNPVGSRVGKKK